ncbi:putative Multi Antimicrobial Extrusion (MATE) Family Protein [Monocercomonoides exilis]|uniref:putative Multi Antimicrobial Extrusion (MATE) Family Protein n=1 Tax=Monocercomonoides exilis TaxID=2049356 RepID=UPI003559C8AB|nr:putative Multi Antimicrobial Extrusion (MATE) Family Protein [Monocercomonoides exilis]|eukprot:MONOS_1576.1-p1 / transcript=MONOS_1576.1 / gene=MONOS_1576 / organism=Monocercomonoides_exilis_PA203 / gene_product=Multi Antimicrobial Extrusion (MATE) Family Protein / transcript_product=Multi Antimicrobial Extrusion (MATE) Family Protein / location=Mono_scaffold00028:90744-95239(-) / protein_length=1480 / sequence_SO=supercontig / SO=protein_coding / is_pseudo=false
MILSEASSIINVFIEKMILSHYNPPDREIGTDVAIVSVGWSTVSIILYLALGIVFFTTNYISQIFGDGQYDQVGVIFWTTNYVTLICWGLCAAFIPAMKPLLMLLDDKSNPTTGLLLRAEIEYSQFMLTWAIAFLLYEHGASMFAGISRPVPIIVVNILSLIMNAGADYLYIIVLKKGYMGAAYGTVTAKGFGSIVFFGWLLWNGKIRKQFKLLSLRSLIPNVKLLLKMCVLGFGSGLVRSLELIVWTVYLFLMQFVGAMEVTAAGLATTVHEVVGMVVYGMAGAQEILVALHLGAKQTGAAVRVTRVSITTLSIYLIFLIALYNGIPHLILRMFVDPKDFTSPDELERLLKSGVTMLRLFSAFSVGEMLCLTLSSTLQASGDTITPTLCSLFAVVSCVVVPGVLIAKKGKLSVLISTVLIVAYSFTCSLPVLVAVLTGRWKKTDLIKEKHDKEKEKEEREHEDKEQTQSDEDLKEQKEEDIRRRKNTKRKEINEEDTEEKGSKNERRLHSKNGKKGKRQKKSTLNRKFHKKNLDEKDKQIDEEQKLGLLSHEEANDDDEDVPSSSELSLESSASQSMDDSDESTSITSAASLSSSSSTSSTEAKKNAEAKIESGIAPLLLHQEDEIVADEYEQKFNMIPISSSEMPFERRVSPSSNAESASVSGSSVGTRMLRTPTLHSVTGETLLSESGSSINAHSIDSGSDALSQSGEVRRRRGSSDKHLSAFASSVATLPTQHKLRASEPKKSNATFSLSSVVAFIHKRPPFSRVPVTSSSLSSSVVPIRPPDMPKAPIVLRKKRNNKSKADGSNLQNDETSNQTEQKMSEKDETERKRIKKKSNSLNNEEEHSIESAKTHIHSHHHDHSDKHKSSRHAFHPHKSHSSSSSSSSESVSATVPFERLNLVIPPFRGLHRTMSYHSMGSSIASFQRFFRPFPFAPSSSASAGRAVGSGASAAAVGMSLAENMLKEMKRDLNFGSCKIERREDENDGELKKMKRKKSSKKNGVDERKSDNKDEEQHMKDLKNQKMVISVKGEREIAGESELYSQQCAFSPDSSETTPLMQSPSTTTAYSSISNSPPLVHSDLDQTYLNGTTIENHLDKQLVFPDDQKDINASKHVSFATHLLPYEHSPLGSPLYSLNSNPEEEEEEKSSDGIGNDGAIGIRMSKRNKGIDEQSSTGNSVVMKDEVSYDLSTASVRSSLLHIGQSDILQGSHVEDNRSLIIERKSSSNNNVEHSNGENAESNTERAKESAALSAEMNVAPPETEVFYTVEVDVEEEEREIKRKEEELEEQREAIRQLEEEEFRRGFADDDDEDEDEEDEANEGGSNKLEDLSSENSNSNGNMMETSDAMKATDGSTKEKVKERTSKAAKKGSKATTMDDGPFLPFDVALKLYQSTPDVPPLSSTSLEPLPVVSDVASKHSKKGKYIILESTASSDNERLPIATEKIKERSEISANDNNNPSNVKSNSSSGKKKQKMKKQ